MFLRQSTASQKILLGPFVDSTDGDTAETALTIANTDIKLFKGGATTLADKNSGGATHISDGYYYAVLDATDTDTVGILEVKVKAAGALRVLRRFYVLEEAVYDALFAASAAGYPTAATVADAVWDEARSGHVAAGSFGEGVIVQTNSDKTGYSLTQSFPTNFASLAITGGGAVTAGTVSDKTGYSLTATTGLGNQTADITGNLSGSVGSVTGAVGSVTGNVGGNVTGSVGSIATGGITSASFASNSITAAALATDAGAEIADAVWDEAQSGHTTAGTFGKYLDAQVSTVGGGSLTAAAIADAVWDEAIAGHLASGSTGESLNAAGGSGDPWVTTLPGSYTGSQAGKILADILADTGTDGVVVASGSKTGYSIGSGGITSSSFASNSITAAALAADAAAEIAGQVWEEDRTAHNTGGSFGEGVKTCFGGVGWVNGDVYGAVVGSVGSVASGGITAASLAASAGEEIADAVWDEARAGHSTTGAFGLFLDAQVSTVGGGSLTAGQIADAVWDEARADHTTAGSFGQGVVAHTVSDKTGYSLSTAPPTAAAIADAVWDEAQSGHTTVGTFGYYLDSAVSGVSTGGVSVSAIADAVWDEVRSGHATAGTFGESLQLTNATVVAAGSTTSTVQLSSPWNTGQASGRTLYLSGKGYNLGTAAGDTYSISPSWSVPADGTAVLIGPLAASTPDALSTVASNVTAIKTKTDAQPSTWPTNFSAMAITSGGVVTVDKTGYILAAAGLDSIAVESGVNARQALSPILAAAAGVLSGATGGAGTIVIKGGNTNTTRVTATVDNDGNRTSVVLSLPS